MYVFRARYFIVAETCRVDATLGVAVKRHTPDRISMYRRVVGESADKSGVTSVSPPIEQDAARSALSAKAVRAIILAIFAVFIALALARCWTNLPWFDEGCFYGPVYNWIVHGHTGTTVMEGKGFPWEGIERHQYWQPPMHLIWDFAWLKIFGLSLVAFRSLSTFAGVCWLISWLFLLTYFRTPIVMRLLAFAFIATDYAVLRAASDGRTDMISAALGLAAVALYLHFRERNFTLAVILSQTFLVCGGLTHPLGGVVYIVLLAYFFIHYGDWRKVRAYHIALALLPYAIGAFGWGLYIAKDPQTFRRIFFGSSAAGRLSGLMNPWLAIKREVILRYLAPFGLFGHSWVLKVKLLIPILYVIAALLVLLIKPVRQQPFLKPFIAMWALAVITVFVVDNQKNGTYMVHLLPFYAVLMAGGLFYLFEHSRFSSRAAALAFAAGFIALQAGGSLIIILSNPYHRLYLPVTNYVLQHARPDDRIVGTSELAFGIGFDRLHDDMALGYYVDKKPDIIIMCPRYEIWYEANRGLPVYDFVQARLAQFQPVFGNEDFQVYLPKDRAAEALAGKS